MTRYTLFILDEEIAHQYYGRESKLYCLFTEYEKATGYDKAIIAKQIKYITKPIPILKVHKQLKRAFQQEKGYEYDGNQHQLKKDDKGSKVTIIIDESIIYMESMNDRNFELESEFFEVMRKVVPTFFAVSIEKQRYGWLRPFKQDVLIPKQGKI